MAGGVSTARFRPVKVVETSVVDDGALERLINEWQERGYELDTIRFVQSEASRRPVMAFLFFLAPEIAATKDED